MSQRRKAGDIVTKRANAGFVRPPGWRWQIHGEPGDEATDSVNGMSWCPLACGDPECFEWSDLWEIDADGKPTGRVACHVCECEMGDL